MCNGICASICRVAYATNHGAATQTRIALESPCPVFSLRDDNYRQCNCHDWRALVRRGVRDAIAALRCESQSNRLENRGTRSSLISCMNNSMGNAIGNNIAIKHRTYIPFFVDYPYYLSLIVTEPTTRSLCPLYTAQSSFLLRSFDRHRCCDYISRSSLLEYFFLIFLSCLFPLNSLILPERTRAARHRPRNRVSHISKEISVPRVFSFS